MATFDFHSTWRLSESRATSDYQIFPGASDYQMFTQASDYEKKKRGKIQVQKYPDITERMF